MKNYTFAIMLLVSTVFAKQAYSQETDSLKQVRIKYIGKDLAITDQKAQQVVLILDQYKENAKIAIGDKSLTPEELTVKMDQLIDEKNMKLKKILTEEQSNKLIPTTERNRTEAPVVGRP